MGITLPSFKKEAHFHRIFFFILLTVACASTLYVLKNYLSLLFASLLYSILIRPLYNLFRNTGKWPRSISAGTTVFITFITIIVPIILIGTVVTQEAFSFRESIDTSDVTIEGSVDAVNTFLLSIPGIAPIDEQGVTEFIDQISGPVGTFLANQLIVIGASSATFVANLFIFLVLVFFILPNLKKLKNYFLKLSPMSDDIDKLYVARIISMTRAMIKGTFLVAVIQGVLAGLLLFVMGVPYILILTLIMILFAIIPVLSTTFVTLPIALYFIFTGDIVRGVSIILFQTLVISTIDNILRPMLASGEGHLHPGILLLAILGGLQMFGFLGIIYGPVILIFFTTSLEIYQKYYK